MSSYALRAKGVISTRISVVFERLQWVAKNVGLLSALFSFFPQGVAFF